VNDLRQGLVDFLGDQAGVRFASFLVFVSGWLQVQHTGRIGCDLSDVGFVASTGRVDIDEIAAIINANFTASTAWQPILHLKRVRALNNESPTSLETNLIDRIRGDIRA
jgi:hypothetical protein